MRVAKGFATGNGRRKGVLGFAVGLGLRCGFGRACGGEVAVILDDGWGYVSAAGAAAAKLYFNTGGGGGDNTAADESRAAGARGNDECGDGGGKTNVVGSRDCDCILQVLLATGNAGGITSVSNDSSSLSANPDPSPEDERLDTRVFLLAPAFPTTVGLTGDLRGDLRGDFSEDGVLWVLKDGSRGGFLRSRLGRWRGRGLWLLVLVLPRVVQVLAGARRA